MQALIFDLNGTVVADEHIFGAAFKKVLEEMGAKNVPEYPHIGGIGVTENWPILRKKYSIITEFTNEELTQKVHTYYLDSISKVRIKKGFKTLLIDARKNNVSCGLSTSSVWSLASEILNEVSLYDAFESITTGEEVLLKKPSPELFLLTCQKMSVEPHNVVIFEDSQAGIEAAKAIDAKTVGIIRNTIQKNSLKKADMLVKDYSTITISYLKTHLFSIVN